MNSSQEAKIRCSSARLRPCLVKLFLASTTALRCSFDAIEFKVSVSATKLQTKRQECQGMSARALAPQRYRWCRNGIMFFACASQVPLRFKARLGPLVVVNISCSTIVRDVATPFPIEHESGSKAILNILAYMCNKSSCASELIVFVFKSITRFGLKYFYN